MRIKLQTIHQLKSPIADPVDFSLRPKYWLSALINLSAKDDANSKRLTSHKRASLHIKNDFFIKELLKTLSGIQTHNIKIPNAQRDGQIIANIEKKQLAGVCSATINSIKKYGWSGSARYFNERLFFCTEFIYKDKATSLFDEFQLWDSELVNILRDFGLSEENEFYIREAIKKIQKKPLPDHAEDPQILWPLDDSCENYVAITPVANNSMIREIANRVAPSKSYVKTKKGYFYQYKTGEIKIGGERPINAGDIVMYLGGWIRLLKAVLPSRKKKAYNPKDWLHYNCRKCESKFKGQYENIILREWICQSCHEEINND